MIFCTVNQAISDLKKGKMIIAVDDKQRENEGDIFLAAQKATKEQITFIVKYTTGIICTPLDEKTAKMLDLKHMIDPKENTEHHGTNFTVTVDAKKEISTGVSAKDRLKTIKVLANPKSKPTDLTRPGHIFPLIAKDGGILVRTGHTEAMVDLLKLAKMKPVGVICEIIKENGDMARLSYLKKFAKKHKIKILAISDLIDYKLEKEKFLEKKAETLLPTKYGLFKAMGFTNKKNNSEYIALVKGKITKKQPALVRVHSGCITGDILGSNKCDCGTQLDLALKKISKAKSGVLVYIQEHEGRGIGLVNKLKAYSYQEKGYDTVEANKKLGFAPDLRQYGVGAQILCELGVKKINLLTNNPKKIASLSGYGLEVVKRTALFGKKTKQNKNYLKTKKEKLGHYL